MTLEHIAWVGIACLSISALAPIFIGIRAFILTQRGEETEMPESYRFLAGSVSLGQGAFQRLREPFAEEKSQLAELSELTQKLKDEDPEND